MLERQFIDSLDFANNSRALRGEIAMSEMPRLQDKLIVLDANFEHGRKEELSYTLRGFRDRDGRPMLEMKLDGLCQLRCQRCLQGLTYPMKLASQLLLVDNWDDYSVEEDEIDSILVDNHLDVLALFEEEILLNLPFAPRHPVGVCRPVKEGYTEEESDRIDKNPFAVLSEFKYK
ncbi:MAG: YceD family protein [Candidatus Nitrotoga sp.]